MKVAIVDDSISLLEHFSSMLRVVPGCEPVVFSKALEGLRWCLSNEPDLVLVDYLMPEMDGLQFIEAFRKDEHGAETPILMVTTCTDKDVLYKALHAGATDFLRKPVDRSEFLARVRNLLKLGQSHKVLANRADWLAEEVRKVTGALFDREREAILVLSRAAEYRDPHAVEHLPRMASYCRLIAEGLGLPADTVDLIHTAAPMHDVGKIGIPDRILLKPGPLDRDETVEMRKHARIGFEILSTGSSPLLRLAAEIALHHHERFDGAGYPSGLRAETIPLCGRIAALADVFDALVTRRLYKEAWSMDDALSYVVSNAGEHFDPDCVAVFCRRWNDVRAVTLRYVSSVSMKRAV